MKYIFLIALLCSFLPQQINPTANKIIADMLISVKGLKSIKCTVKDFERLDGKMNEGEEKIKMNLNPFKIYIFMVKPDQGLEVLWAANLNNGKALIHPNSFPYININLDPYGDLMRRGGHHSIFDLNLNYIAEIISDLTVKSKNDFQEYFLYKGEVKFNNRMCYKIIIEFNDFKYVKYKVKKGETLLSIARTNHISEYMILEKNKGVKNYEDVKEGDEIIIPNAYALKTILYIDKETNLPIVQEMHDDKGLFERYEYYNIEINPAISNNEFTEDYKGYHF